MIKQVIRSLRPSSNSNKPDEVVLHIGAPKCGSSAIQRFCVTHREALLKLGYFYPEHSLDVNGVSGGHTQLAGALINDKREQARTTFQHWLNEAKKRQACLLISAEALYGQHAAMSEFCEGLNVKVISFLRHPIEYLLANHNQGIKRHMSTRRLGELLPELLGKSTGHLVGEPLLKWADAFGDDSCAFMPFFSPDSGGQPVEQCFMKALGIETQMSFQLQQLGGQTNRSYVKSALELKRLLNTVLGDLPAHDAHQVDWSLQGYSDRARGESGYTMADLTMEIRERLEEHLLKQMAPVVKNFPELKAVADVPVEVSLESSHWLDLAAPLAALATDAPQVTNDIRQRAVKQREQGRQDYTFCKLLDVLGIEFNEPGGVEPTPGLTVHQRNTLSKPHAREADCLREMAVLLERQGLLADALFVIKRAQEKRPEGKGIQRIQARMEQKQQIQQASQAASEDKRPEAGQS